MGWFDVHAHLTDRRLAAQEADVVARAMAQGVTTIISNGLNPTDNAAVLALSARYPDLIRPALGHKCERCWKFATELRSADGYDAACCPDCLSAVRVLASR